MIKQWQNAVLPGASATFISSLVPQHPQYAPMHAALKQLLTDSHPWPQLKNRETLRPSRVSDDVPALREILQRTRMLSAQTTAPTPADDAVPTARIPVSQSAQPAAVSPSATSVGDLAAQTPEMAGNVQSSMTDTGSDNVYDAALVDAVKRFQQWQGLERWRYRSTCARMA